MTEFTPLASLFGGVLIGISATVLMRGVGRIAGISGITGGLLVRQPRYEAAWRIAFILGLLGAAILATALPLSMGFLSANLPLTVHIESPWWIIVVAGLLVGYGTRLGSGCTSGHGVCGIGRLSGRSIVATMGFMAVAALTVFISKFVTGGI